MGHWGQKVSEVKELRSGKMGHCETKVSERSKNLELVRWVTGDKRSWSRSKNLEW